MKTDRIAYAEDVSTWQPLSRITVGKDILELLSSSMYIDPMTIYREYIQNSADAIDEGRSQGFSSGRVEINIDIPTRNVCIRDNGIGVRRENFESQLGTFGGSIKRGTSGRGFRGVGRLSGLGYCQKLTFRTRAAGGDGNISEMEWDCRKIKNLLRSNDKRWSLEDLLTEVVSVRRKISDDQDHTPFFEVEMSGVIRHKNDVLLNRDVIYDYLSEIAPVPFHPDFSFGEQILKSLENKVSLGNLEILVSGKGELVYRPYRDYIEVNGELYDKFREMEIFTLPSNDEGIAAFGWFLHHKYKGAIPDKRISGIRARCGNIQIGGRDLFADVYKENRFNSWTVGEIHIIDERITPNGRRDYFEQGVHLDNLLNHLTPFTRGITTRCRESSRIRNRLHEFSRFETIVNEKLEAIQSGLIDEATRKIFIAKIVEVIIEMNGLTTSVGETIEVSLKERLNVLRKNLALAIESSQNENVLDSLPKSKRATYEKVFGLIYECSENQVAARKLIDRIVNRLHTEKNLLQN